MLLFGLSSQLFYTLQNEGNSTVPHVQRNSNAVQVGEILDFGFLPTNRCPILDKCIVLIANF
jgi:hypothetical protein